MSYPKDEPPRPKAEEPTEDTGKAIGVERPGGRVISMDLEMSPSILKAHVRAVLERLRRSKGRRD